LTNQLDISLKFLFLTVANPVVTIMPSMPIKSQYTEVNFSSNFFAFLAII